VSTAGDWLPGRPTTSGAAKPTNSFASDLPTPTEARVRYILGSASSLHWDWLREGAVSRTHAFRVFGKEFSLHSKSYFDFLISGDEGRS